jgi:hypothetical protein
MVGMDKSSIVEVAMMVLLAVVVLMLREARRRFSLSWLLMLMTFAAISLGASAIFFGALLRKFPN